MHASFPESFDINISSSDNKPSFDKIFSSHPQTDASCPPLKGVQLVAETHSDVVVNQKTRPSTTLNVPQQKIMNFKQYKTLVLSGNSTNSILILGALQRLFEQGMLETVQTYVAVSSGTIISVLLAIGYTPLEILIYICSEQVYNTVPVFNLLNVLVTGKPALDFGPIKTCLEKMICLKLGHVPTLKTLYELTEKFIIFSVYNLTDKKREYISTAGATTRGFEPGGCIKNYESLLVTDAIHMSCNFPIIFKPVEFNNKLYIDGGLADAFPVDLAISLNQNPTLGVYIKNPIPDYEYQETPANIFHLLKTLFSIYTEESLEDKVLRNSTKCDIIQLCHESNFFNFNSNNQDLLHLFDRGYGEVGNF